MKPLTLFIVMTLAMRVAAQSPPVNLWPNPSLEADSDHDGTPDFWIKGGGDASSVPLDIWDASNAASGTHSLAVRDNSLTMYGGWFSEFVAVMPGDRYVLTFKRRGCASEDGMEVRARYVSSSNTFVSNVRFPVSGCQLTWEQVTAELTIPPGVTKLNLEIVTGLPVQLLGTNWIDDISLVTNETVAPLIITQPQSRIVISGGSVSFSVIATGTPPPAYQWYFHGGPIPGAVAATYTISSAGLIHAGNYSVVVSNEAGRVESDPAMLQVFEPPSIVTQPQGERVIAGRTVAFTVVAGGVPTPNYQWYFDGAPIEGAVMPMYTIPIAEVSHTGSYSVVVSNAAGTIESNPAHLQVFEPPFAIIVPTNAIVLVGSNLVVWADVVGDGPFTYQWFFKNRKLAGQTNAILVLSNLQLRTRGLYRVEVRDAAGEIRSSGVQVQVVVAPTIISQARTITAKAGKRVTLRVAAKGSKPFAYLWFKDGNAIEQATNRVFTIPAVQVGDAGLYSVLISNIGGSQERLRAELIVIP